MPFDNWIKQLSKYMNSLRRNARFERERQEFVFLLGIAIGRRQRLSLEEGDAYRETFPSVVGIVNLDQLEPHKTLWWLVAMPEAVRNWFYYQPTLRRALEESFGHPLSELGATPILPPAAHALFVLHLKEIASWNGKHLTNKEAESIIERLLPTLKNN